MGKGSFTPFPYWEWVKPDVNSLIGIDRYHVFKESADTILCRYLPPKVSADADTSAPRYWPILFFADTYRPRYRPILFFADTCRPDADTSTPRYRPILFFLPINIPCRFFMPILNADSSCRYFVPILQADSSSRFFRPIPCRHEESSLQIGMKNRHEGMSSA